MTEEEKAAKQRALAKSLQEIQDRMNELSDDIREVLPEFVVIGLRVRTEDEMDQLRRAGQLKEGEGQSTLFFYARTNSILNMLAITNGGLEKLQENLKDNEEIIAMDGDGNKTAVGMLDFLEGRT